MTNNILNECINNYLNNGKKQEDKDNLIKALIDNKFYIIENVDNLKFHRVHKTKKYKNKNLNYKKEISVYINKGVWYLFIFTDLSKIKDINKNIYNNVRKMNLKEFYKYIEYDYGCYDYIILNPMDEEIYLYLDEIYDLLQKY